MADHRTMRTHIVIIAAALVASATAFTTTSRADAPTGEYSIAVAHICTGALLFDHVHEIGTRAGALAVARDIRASTARRLRRVEAVQTPTQLRSLGRQWIALQRRLAAVYAQTWVRIYDTIAAADTPSQRAHLATRLTQLVHAPDSLKRAAGRLDLRLHVPDCTGGG